VEVKPSQSLNFSMFVYIFKVKMSHGRGGESDEKSVQVLPYTRNFLAVAKKACLAYLPVAGSVSCVIFTSHITNPRILER